MAKDKKEDNRDSVFGQAAGYVFMFVGFILLALLGDH